jgi:bifunctional DNase/RNase
VEDLCKVTLKWMALDPLTKMPIVILKDDEGNRVLPIWIGMFEANAIALEMEKVETPRPLTHDLIMTLLSSLGARIARVVVHDLRESTFFAVIVMEFDGREVEVDSRPSDAIALALRASAPIFVTRTVMDKSQTLTVDEDAFDETKVKEWLDTLKPEDFGKFPM